MLSLNNFVDISDNKQVLKKYNKHFKKLRTMWKIDEKFYKNELSKTTYTKGKGKSKTKMWVSKNKYFFVKEVYKSEYNNIEHFFLDYYNHFKKYKHSFLPKICGVYKKNKVLYMVQINLNPYTDDDHWIFDLKGSHRKRGKYSNNKQDKKTKVIKYFGKNNDFGDSSIYIKNAKEIKKQIKKDTLFLKNNNFIDYSLLLCLKKKNTYIKKKDINNWSIGYLKGPGPSTKTKLYINFGIIDIFQKYNIKKKIESFYRSTSDLFKRNKSEISVINSFSYKKRFDKTMLNIIKKM